MPLKFGRGGPAILHLLFTNDILLIVEASSSNAQTILDILDKFAGCSALGSPSTKISPVFHSLITPPQSALNLFATCWILLLELANGLFKWALSRAKKTQIEKEL